VSPQGPRPVNIPSGSEPKSFKTWQIAVAAAVLGGIAIMIALGVAASKSKKKDTGLETSEYTGPERRKKQRRSAARASSMDRREDFNSPPADLAAVSTVTAGGAANSFDDSSLSGPEPTDVFVPPEAKPPVDSLFAETDSSAPSPDSGGDNFDIFAEPEKQGGKVESRRPRAERETTKPAPKPASHDLDSSGIIFLESAPASDEPSSAPWESNEGLESMPALKTDTPSPVEPVAQGKSGGKPPSGDRPPWETDSVTATSRSDADSSFDLLGDDSLPLLPEARKEGAKSEGSRKADKPKKPTEASLSEALDLSGPPIFSEAPPKDLGLASASPSAKAQRDSEPENVGPPDVSFRGIKSPEFAETVTDMDSMLRLSDTLPGFDLPPGETTATAGPPREPIVLDFPQKGMERTLKLSRRELQQDPDLILDQPHHSSSSHGEKSGGDVDGGEGLEVFRADETIQIDLKELEKSRSPMDLEGTLREIRIDEPVMQPSGGGDNFDKEREQGFAAFKQANWDDAVIHLSIAAALRPEAADVKEQLRRARRMRKEREG